MNAVNLIEAALAAGAIGIAKAIFGEADKQAYQSLKTLVQGQFAGKSDAELVLVKHEKKPSAWREPLKEVLVETGADKEEDIIEAAQKLMNLVNSQPAAMSKFNTQVYGNVEGFVQGDHATVTMTFNDKPT